MNTFKITKVLIWCDEPQLFLAQITYKPLFDDVTCLCMALADRLEGVSEYLVIACTEDDLAKIANNKIDLRTFFNVPNARVVLTNWKRMILIEERPITDDMLPEAGFIEFEIPA